ncbi:MAG: RpiB/LacA/LacB family sugar-phosphate isomerase [Bacillota bacterium]|jgi:ribose 5-phosphate isomerase B
MKIAIGSDHLGLELKKKIISRFSGASYQFEDYGTYDAEPVDYPDIGLKVAAAVASGQEKRGILICGTGIGMAITANKVKGVFAAVCHDLYSTERSILSNNIQIMCLGALVIGPAATLALVDQWLKLEFKNSPSVRKVAKIKAIENQ